MIIDKDNANKNFKEICILEHDKMHNLLNDSRSSDIIHNSNTGFLYYPIPIGIESPQLINKFNEEDIQPNRIYIFNKYSNQYTELYEFLEQTPLIKINSIAIICGNLGAKKVEIKQINYDGTNENLEATLGGGIKGGIKKEEEDVISVGGKANVDFIYSIVRTLRQSINLKIEFKGEEHPNKALEIAKEKGLLKDIVVKNLIDNYKLIKKQELNIDLFSEIQKVVKSSAILNLEPLLLEKLFKGSMDLYLNIAKEAKEKHILSFRMYAEF